MSRSQKSYPKQCSRNVRVHFERERNVLLPEPVTSRSLVQHYNIVTRSSRSSLVPCSLLDGGEIKSWSYLAPANISILIQDIRYSSQFIAFDQQEIILLPLMTYYHWHWQLIIVWLMEHDISAFSCKLQ